MRVGQSIHGHNSLPHWCSPFSLEGGMSKRALHVLQHQGNRPDWVYNIGIQVTPGRGRYWGTNIVTFAPQFVLDNQSGCKLAIAQHFVTKKEIRQQEYLTALPLCSLPFHWPRVDLDQLLAVKILDIDHCRWSGGFYIDRINSFHINMRDPCGTCHLLKVEVVQQGPTFFIVFADADVMPPPFRIDNCTDVPVLYYQDKTGDDRLKTFIEPQKSIPYAWDEPTVTPLRLTLGIMGGTSASYSLDKLEEGEQLHYENFIYLAATATFDTSWNGPTPELVLDCVHNNNIMFRRKEKSKRNQLWRMTGSGMLEHEGSMPPRDPRNPSTNSEPGLVLDIADLAPRPGQCVPLTLRKPDVCRRSTQTWRFTEQGQLCCLAGMMCVQAVGGDRGLQDGAIAVLGPGPSSDQQSIHSDKPSTKVASPMTTSDSWPSGFEYSGAASRNIPGSNIGTSKPTPPRSAHVPRHMLISRQKLRPGSGCISVRVSMDGPIRVIELVDIQQRQVVKRMTMEKDLEDWEVYDELKGKKKGNFRIPASGFVTELSITLKNGIGVSLVNSLSEELLYLTLKNISVEVVAKPTAITLDASVAHIQADNQMGGAQRSVVLFVSPTSRRDVLDNTPALYISAHKVPSGRWKAEIFKHLYVSTKRMTVHIEEQLLWKLLQLTGMGKDDRTLNRLDETFDTHRALSAVTSIQSTRYYFGTVKLSVNRVTLSMVTSSKLTPDLKAIKNVMPMRLIAFEQANIDMRSFEQYHVFETGPFLISEITNHYGGELRGQAAKILGSIDFLGNPLGLVHDITEGIAGFVKDGNVGGLLKNVTHGVSNSTAKVMSSISDGISTVGLDEDHNSKREELRTVTSGSSSDHIMAGFRGLSHGLVGGVTSLFSQSISGAQQEGLGGFIKGMGKGVIGTVTKPVSGVLDLTSGVANALRDSSTRTSNRDPGRVRLPRCTQGPGGLLPPYSQAAAEALTVLHELNDNNFSEHLIAMEQLTVDASGDGNMHVLITNRQVFFLNARRARTDNIVLKISHSDILHCSSITTDGKFYVELTRKTSLSPDASSTSLNKPRVRCDRLNIAKKVAQQIKYAKNLFEERYQTLDVDNSSDDEDW
ncbi:hypothetical protein EGW08_007832 [Elysia chlorotica]|uniref:Uncharacterized protein n=1 Tax=Elysia chlorotica TaxID=188477 RepID=A0A3S1BII8_ELYCH|nr:hypothetical protein EGW08_007832 [Elysia chlorotica]